MKLCVKNVRIYLMVRVQRSQEVTKVIQRKLVSEYEARLLKQYYSTSRPQSQAKKLLMTHLTAANDNVSYHQLCQS